VALLDCYGLPLIETRVVSGSEAAAAAAEVSLILADVAVASTGAIGWAHRSGHPRAVALLPPRQNHQSRSRALLSLHRPRPSQCGSPPRP